MRMMHLSIPLWFMLAAACGGEEGTEAAPSAPASTGGGAGASGAASGGAGAGAGGVAGGGGTGGAAGATGTGGAGAGGSGAGGAAGSAGGGMGQTAAVDLLFMIDNSASMADKQQVLAQTVPDLVDRLVNPRCVKADASGKLVPLPKGEQPKTAADACPAGASREFAPVADIHVGVISSSLGGHGADICVDVAQGDPSQIAQSNFTKNDRARLLARGARTDTTKIEFPAVPTWNDAGFFAWDPAGTKNVPAGESNSETLKKNVTDVVVGVDQIGCGYEASLEAWYRFLVEPNPPAKVSPPSKVGESPVVEGTDDILLKQRTDFLRPDSLLAVVVLSDENDCSIIDGTLPELVCEDPVIDPATGIATSCASAPMGWPKGYVEGNFRALTSVDGDRVSGAAFPANYLLAQQKANGEFHLFGATAACQSDPSSPDCTSCAFAPDDANCQGGPNLPPAEDPVQLRCWNAKQRFGWDALYPLQRYVAGLKQPKVYDRNGFLVTNPLFDDLPFAAAQRAGMPLARPKLERDPKNVLFTTIVGVPWQDVARDPKNLGAGFKTAVDLGDGPGSAIDWELILGDPFYRDADATKKGRKPLDPLMVESSKPRPKAKHPITGEEVGQGTGWNSVNGHEWDTAFGDLQYACIFALAQSRDCSNGASSCDCTDPSLGNPLCEKLDASGKGDGVASTTQFGAKGYPGTRFLQVAKDVGDTAVVASICAASLSDQSSPDYGYRPAVGALVDRMSKSLTKAP